MSTTDFLADIQIEAIDRHGLLAEITTIITNSKTAVRSINARANKNKQAVINLTIQVGDVEELEKVMRDFRKIQEVIDVYRNRNQGVI